MKAVFWLGITFLTQISRWRFKQSRISMLMSHIYVLGRFVNFLVIFRYIGWFQKISIPYHGRHLGIPRERGGFLDWNSKGMGGGEVFQLRIQWISRGKMAKALLEIADLLTFPVCKWSTNRPRKKYAFMQMGKQMGCAASSTSMRP